MIWKQPVNLEFINQFNKDTLAENLGIEFIEIGDDYLVAKMPVDHRTVQPMRILHGGANVALAETLGSVAGTLSLDDFDNQTVVGVEINANHLKAVKSGWVFGKVTPIRLGRTIQVWNIDIRDADENLCCVSRLTIAVVSRKP